MKMDVLISRNSVIEMLTEIETNSCFPTFTMLKQMILNIPAAYDVDKVVKEIRNEYGCKNCEYADTFNSDICDCCCELDGVNDICEIIRKGCANLYTREMLNSISNSDFFYRAFSYYLEHGNKIPIDHVRNIVRIDAINYFIENSYTMEDDDILDDYVNLIMTAYQAIIEYEKIFS